MSKLDLQNKSKEELIAMLKELRVKILELSFDLTENKLKDSSSINKTKKNIARILTIINKSN